MYGRYIHNIYCCDSSSLAFIQSFLRSICYVVQSKNKTSQINIESMFSVPVFHFLSKRFADSIFLFVSISFILPREWRERKKPLWERVHITQTNSNKHHSNLQWMKTEIFQRKMEMSTGKSNNYKIWLLANGHIGDVTNNSSLLRTHFTCVYVYMPTMLTHLPRWRRKLLTFTQIWVITL